MLGTQQSPKTTPINYGGNKQPQQHQTTVSVSGQTEFPEALESVKVINSKLINMLTNPSAAVIQKLMDVDFIYMLDSGGQPPFREMLPHLAQQASAIVLMQKLKLS